MMVDRQKTPLTCYNCRRVGHISRNCPSPATPETLARRSATPNKFRAFATDSAPPPNPGIDVSSLVEEIAKLRESVGALQKENNELRQDFCAGKE